MKTIPYREAVGSLLWLSNGTRPDVAFAGNQVARYMENPGVKHWNAVLRILKCLKGTLHLNMVFDGSMQSRDTSGFFSYPKPDEYIC